MRWRRIESKRHSMILTSTCQKHMHLDVNQIRNQNLSRHDLNVKNAEVFLVPKELTSSIWNIFIPRYIHPMYIFDHQIFCHFYFKFCRMKRFLNHSGSAQNVARLSELKLDTICTCPIISKRKSRQACSASIARWALTQIGSSLAIKEPVLRRIKKMHERKRRKSGT